MVNDDQMIDQAAGCAQSRELLDDEVVRECIKLNICKPFRAEIDRLREERDQLIEQLCKGETNANLHEKIAEQEEEIERLREAGVGYSQQTVDALTKERDDLDASEQQYARRVIGLNGRIERLEETITAQQDAVTAALGATAEIERLRESLSIQESDHEENKRLREVIDGTRRDHKIELDICKMWRDQILERHNTLRSRLAAAIRFHEDEIAECEESECDFCDGRRVLIAKLRGGE